MSEHTIPLHILNAAQVVTDLIAEAREIDQDQSAQRPLTSTELNRLATLLNAMGVALHVDPNGTEAYATEKSAENVNKASRALSQAWVACYQQEKIQEVVENLTPKK